MGPKWSPGMKSGDSKRSKLAKSQKTKKATSKVVDITKSEGEEVNPSSKQSQDEETCATAWSKDDLSPVMKLKRVHPTSGGVDTPQQGHQYVTDKETKTATMVLELLWETEDPTATDNTKTPPGEAAHFEGTGLMDNIRSSLRKKKGTHSHWTMQQVTVDTPVINSSTSSRDWVHPTPWWWLQVNWQAAMVEVVEEARENHGLPQSPGLWLTSLEALAVEVVWLLRKMVKKQTT